MKSFKIEQAKSKQNEIRKNIEQKENRLRELDESKEKLMEAGMEIQASDIDEEIKNTIMDRINSGLKEISEKGKEEIIEMDDSLQELEEIRSETEESLESNLSESEKLAAKKEFLDKFGLDGSVDNTVNDLQRNQQELESLYESLLEDEKNLKDIEGMFDYEKTDFQTSLRQFVRNDMEVISLKKTLSSEITSSSEEEDNDIYGQIKERKYKEAIDYDLNGRL